MSEQEHIEATNTTSATEKRDSTADSSDRDIDTFEDANDTSPVERPRTASVARSRSLTNQRSASIKSESKETRDPTLVPVVLETETSGGAQEDDIRQPNSPLLTSHRISTESLDNVNLDEDGGPLKQKPSSVEKRHLPSKSTSTSKSVLEGLSGALPSVPWSPPPQAPPSNSLPPPASASTRKLTSPFSWLSRNTSHKEPQISPPVPIPNHEARRNTASSILTVGSNPEMMLSKLDVGQEFDGTMGTKRPSRSNLRDRFKLVRMREEAGITEVPEGDKVTDGFRGFMGRSATFGLSLASPTPQAEGKEPGSPRPPSPNPALAPGTAAGASSGPSPPVDWDLWQAVVDEGPTAVARTSPEELNRAIIAGIPNAIRGVVWQILASSKNEELESVYRDLVSRGTDKDKDRMSGSSGSASIAPSTNGDKREEILSSSASSVHSDHSAPSSSITNGLRSPSPPKDLEKLAKAQAAIVTEQKKKTKEDAAALLKLEKAIKRDLGARTSF